MSKPDAGYINDPWLEPDFNTVDIMRSYLISAAAAGLCLAAGWTTIKAGNTILGYTIFVIGVANVGLVWKQMREADDA